MFGRCFFVFSIIVVSGAAAADTGYPRLVETVVDRLELPSLEQLSATLPELAEATSILCTSQNEENRSRVEDAFHEVMDAWQIAQIYAFGPLVRKGRFSRVHFWPGRVGSANRYVRKILNSKPDDLTNPMEIGNKSVAIHSLAAYERFLFSGEEGRVTHKIDPYQCHVAIAISEFQKGLIAEAPNEWKGPEGFRETLLKPDANNPSYRTSRNAANGIFGLLAGGLERIARFKLRRALGTSIDKVKPWRLENWRSRRAKRNLLVNILTLKTLVSARGGVGALLRNKSGGAEANQIDRSLLHIEQRLTNLPEPVYISIADEEGWREMDNLHAEIEKLLRMTTGPVAEKLGLVVGFNLLDGD
jgi:predicted lipoprotein